MSKRLIKTTVLFSFMDPKANYLTLQILLLRVNIIPVLKFYYNFIFSTILIMCYPSFIKVKFNNFVYLFDIKLI